MVALASFILATSLTGLAAAQNLFQITNPSPSSWWVAESINLLAWECKPGNPSSFTVLVSNSNPTILTAPMPIIAIQANSDCSKTITEQQSNQPPATGYRILLANILNNTDVYAQSDEFEIKPVNSPYPATSTPAAPSATGSGAATSSSTTAQSNGSKGVVSDKTFGLGIAAALAGGLTYLM